MAIIAEKELSESKQRQVQGIKLDKERDVYQGRLILYAANVKDQQTRVIYEKVVLMLKEDVSIYKINGLTRPTVYNIKKRAGI